LVKMTGPASPSRPVRAPSSSFLPTARLSQLDLLVNAMACSSLAIPPGSRVHHDGLRPNCRRSACLKQSRVDLPSPEKPGPRTGGWQAEGEAWTHCEVETAVGGTGSKPDSSATAT